MKHPGHLRPGRTLATFALVLALSHVASPSASAAFVASGTILGPGTTVFDGWDAAYSILDEVEVEKSQVERNFHRIWFGLGTSEGGQEEASPENPIETVYLRIDHKGSVADVKANWNIQFNLGSAPPGRVDHLLSMRPEVVDDQVVVLVRLSEYTPYPLLGAFTTNAFKNNTRTETATYDAAATIKARTGTWDGVHYGFELAIPHTWFATAPAAQLAADGSGSRWLTGAAFSSGGTFGAVATTWDELLDSSGNTMTLVSEPATGATTFERANATSLVFAQQPESGVALERLGPFAVHVHNETGQIEASASHFVTLALGEAPADATLSGTRTVQAIDGVATFSDLTVDRAGAYSLVATGGNLFPDESMVFNVAARMPAIDVIGIVAGDGTPQAGLWGGWDAPPGMSDVRSSNFLAVQNTGNVHEVDFRVAFAPEGLEGQVDPKWSVPANLLEFRCGYTASATPAVALAQAPWGSDAPGSAACSFPAGSAGQGTMYVQYRISSVPQVLPAQPYQGAFTVHLEE